MRKLGYLTTATLLTLFLGCTTIRESATPRTATEQLLLSTATNQALGAMDLGPLSGWNVFFDTSNVEAYEKEYVIASVREELARAGARLVASRDAAELVVEARVGALANDRTDFIIGLPSLTVPVPMAGPATTPEMALIKIGSQYGRAALGLFACRKDDGAHVYSSGQKYGDAYVKRYVALFVIPYKRTNIPALENEGVIEGL